MNDNTSIPQVDVSSLDDSVVLLDVREPNEYQAGHAPGAVSIPMGEVRDRMAELPTVDGPLRVICRAGSRSDKVAEFLARNGVSAVNVTGGTTAWAEAGKPLVSESGDEPSVVAPATPPPPEV